MRITLAQMNSGRDVEDNLRLGAYRRQGEPTSGAAQSDSGATVPANSEEEAGVVACAHCGTRNQQGYKFCRECIADVSSGTPQRASREQPNGY